MRRWARSLVAASWGGWGVLAAAAGASAVVAFNGAQDEPPLGGQFGAVMRDAFSLDQVFSMFLSSVRDRHPSLADVEESEFDARVLAALRVRLDLEPERRRRSAISQLPMPGEAAVAVAPLPPAASLAELRAEALRQLESGDHDPARGRLEELADRWLGEPDATTPEALRERFELLLDALVDALEDPFTTVLHARELGRAMFTELLGVPSATGLLASAPDAAGNFTLDLVLRGSDAGAKGARKGDQLRAVDGRPVAGLPRWKVQEWIDVPCQLTLARDGFAAEFSLEVGSYSPTAGATRHALLDDIGYLAFPLFRAGAFLELRDATRALQREGARAIVLDLRGNPGGLIVEAGAIANLFVDSGKRVVDTQSRDGSGDIDMTTGRAAFPVLPRVVLQDGSSASASEILAAAFQDHRRALLVGETSYGKGIGQIQVTLPYLLPGETTVTPAMELMSLTVLSARSPNGHDWHGKGVAADVRASAAPDTPERFAARQRYFASEALRKQIDRMVLSDSAVAKIRVPGQAPELLVDAAHAAELAVESAEAHEALKEVGRVLLIGKHPELCACPELDPPLAKALRAAQAALRKSGG